MELSTRGVVRERLEMPPSSPFDPHPRTKIGCICLVPLTPGVKSSDTYLGLNCYKGRGLILPGGTWEPERDRSFHNGAVRELMEETGIHVPSCRYLWHGPDGFGYTCFAFLADEAHGVATDMGSGVPQAVTPNDLYASKLGAYYRILFEIAYATLITAKRFPITFQQDFTL